ncbi:MAG: Uma2 family endonuclease [Planctomycetota bacterium]
MSALEAFQPRYTVGDYQQWEGDWELWDGIAVSMSPSPFGNHSALVARLISELSSAIDAQARNAVVLTALDWIVSKTTVVRPDVLVICDEPTAEHLRSTPPFVAEVLSPSTRERDLTFKRDLYQQEGVSSYLTLDPENKELRWFGEGAPRGWDGSVVDDTISLGLCADCSLDLKHSRLFRR